MKRVVDTKKLTRYIVGCFTAGAPTTYREDEHGEFVKLSDLEACPEVAEVEGFKDELKRKIGIACWSHNIDKLVFEEIKEIIDSMPTPVIRKKENDEKDSDD